MHHLFLRAINKRLLAGFLFLAFFMSGLMIGYGTGIKEGTTRLALTPITVTHSPAVLGAEQVVALNINVEATLNSGKIQYPLADLGNCDNLDTCLTFCAVPENVTDCNTWAESQN